MARKLRLQFESAIYHVINRGNYRQDVFASVGAAKAFEQTLVEPEKRVRLRMLISASKAGRFQPWALKRRLEFAERYPAHSIEFSFAGCVKPRCCMKGRLGDPPLPPDPAMQSGSKTPLYLFTAGD